MAIAPDALIGLVTGLTGTAIAYFAFRNDVANARREATNTALEQARLIERRFANIESELKLQAVELSDLRDDCNSDKTRNERILSEVQQTTDEIFNFLTIHPIGKSNKN